VLDRQTCTSVPPPPPFHPEHSRRLGTIGGGGSQCFGRSTFHPSVRPTAHLNPQLINSAPTILLVRNAELEKAQREAARAELIKKQREQLVASASAKKFKYKFVSQVNDQVRERRIGTDRHRGMWLWTDSRVAPASLRESRARSRLGVLA
jgi:hypothetical protein